MAASTAAGENGKRNPNIDKRAPMKYKKPSPVRVRSVDEAVRNPLRHK